MTYRPSRRNWIKIWVDEWLSGTTRFELNEHERGVWADLLALGGKSKYPGIIAAGKYDDGYRGYPINWLAGSLVLGVENLKTALKKCECYGKIKIETKTHDGTENIIIHIVNWEKYQSEYLRQKEYYHAKTDSADKPVSQKKYRRKIVRDEIPGPVKIKQ